MAEGDDFVRRLGMDPPLTPPRSHARAKNPNGASPAPRRPSRRIDEAANDAVTEYSLSRIFVERALPYLRWSPGLGWMVHRGSHWERDSMLERMTLAQRIAHEAAHGSKRADKLESAATRNAIVMQAQPDPQLGVPDADWDRDPFALNTPAGIVDLRSGNLRPRTAADLVTLCTACSPGFFDACPTWLRFLREVFPDSEEMPDFIQRSIGYWLTGDRREQVFWFLHGVGSNGKSTFVDLVLWLLGTYATKLPAASLMQSRGERHPTDLAGLRGRRLAISSELEEHQHFAEALVKELTGDEKLSARFMRQDFFEFAMQQKHVLAGNAKPRLHGGDAAMARRLLLVPFTQTFAAERRDRTLLDKLKDEGQAILAWAIRGAVLWAATGLVVPDTVRTASADYMNEQDDLRLWIEEKCHCAGEGRGEDLYRSFADWKRARGEHPPSAIGWAERVQRLEGVTRRRSNGTRYAGLSLRADELDRLRDEEPRGWHK
jgi:putative DNA primase/helicase